MYISFKKPEIPYDKSEEYLKKQQNIDAMLVLVRIIEIPQNIIESEKVLRQDAVKKISKILETL